MIFITTYYVSVRGRRGQVPGEDSPGARGWRPGEAESKPKGNRREAGEKAIRDPDEVCRKVSCGGPGPEEG
jgi:hypothetical protein